MVSIYDEYSRMSQLDTLVENLERALARSQHDTYEASTSYVPKYRSDRTRLQKLNHKKKSSEISAPSRQKIKKKKYISKSNWLRDSSQEDESEKESWLRAGRAFNQSIIPISRQNTMDKDDKDQLEGSDSSSNNDFVKVEHKDTQKMESPNHDHRLIDEYAHQLVNDVQNAVFGENRLPENRDGHGDDVNNLAEDEFTHNQARVDSPIHDFEPEPENILMPQAAYGGAAAHQAPSPNQDQLPDFLEGNEQQQDYQISESPVRDQGACIEEEFTQRHYSPVGASPFRDDSPLPDNNEDISPTSPIKALVDEFDPYKKKVEHFVNAESPTKQASQSIGSPCHGECWATVIDLVHWRDPKKSGLVLGVILTILIAFYTTSVISVVAYSLILLLAASVTLKVAQVGCTKLGKNTEQIEQVQNMINNAAHELPADKVHQQVDVLLEYLNHSIVVLRRLILVEDVVETIKFGLFLWALTYLGHWISGITLAIIAVLAAFSIPKVYELYKAPIDKYLDIAIGYINKFDEMLQANVPFLKRKAE